MKSRAELYRWLINKIAKSPIKDIDPETGEEAYYLENSARDKIWYKTQFPREKDHYRIDRANGIKEWYKGGVLHNEDGPAKIYPGGKEEYWYNGKKIEKQNKEKQDVPIIVGQNADGTWQYDEVNVLVDWSGTILYSLDDNSPIWAFDPRTLELMYQPKFRQAYEKKVPIAKIKDIEGGTIGMYEPAEHRTIRKWE